MYERGSFIGFWAWSFFMPEALDNALNPMNEPLINTFQIYTPWFLPLTRQDSTLLNCYYAKLYTNWKYSISMIICARAKTSHQYVLLPSDIIYLCNSKFAILCFYQLQPASNCLQTNHCNEIMSANEVAILVPILLSDNDDYVRNIFNQYIKQIFTALLFRKRLKTSPLGDWRPWAYCFPLSK